MVASYDESVGASIGEQWDDVAEAFEKKHPDVQVAVERVPFEKLDATLARRVAAGRAPDIAQSNVFSRFAEQGLLYAASDLFDVATEADFTPSLVKAGEVDLIQYGIPLMASTPRLFYNKALFKKAGIAAPPRSWAELRTAAQALRTAGVPTPYGLQFGPEAAEDELFAWLLAGDGNYTTSGGYSFDTRENAAVLGWLRDNLVADGLAGDPARLTRTSAYEQFLGGRIGMMLAHPVLMDAADGAELPYGHAAFPGRRPGAAPPMGINDWLLAFRRNDRRKACGDFLGFVYGKESTAGYGAGQAAALPVTVSGAQAATAGGGNRLGAFIEQLPRARFQPSALHSWPAVRSAVRENIGAAVRRDGDPAAVLSRLQSTASQAESGARP
ncbi:extracellular solute-binding protein [Streptomyces triticagri]|nr:extracellular solute-binding protein [Streptomyces triticagri]